MNPHFRRFFVVTSLACLTFSAVALAEPIEFSEISLLVRARESEPSIIREVTERKLVRPLTPQQETALKAQGATESLIQALRRSAVVLAQADATAFESRRERARSGGQEAPRGARAGAQARSSSEDVHVFEVSTGSPINLSQWGGPHYEFAFRAPQRLDDGREDAVMIDTIRTGTHVATYLGAGRAEDSTTIFDRRNYVSVMDHSFTRGLRIDRRNPVRVKGSPYTLYPVYAAGGVALYYISGTSESVKLAVRTAAPL